MKKYINIAFIYAIAAIACGVFYREFTKLQSFSGHTMLAYTHLHLFTLGALLFLLIAAFSCITDLDQQKPFGWFMRLYNIGLPFMVIMLFVRGIPQVLGTEISSGLSSAISGLSGVAHILITAALVLLFLSLKSCRATAVAAKKDF